MGRFEDAVQFYYRALEIEPDDEDIKADREDCLDDLSKKG